MKCFLRQLKKLLVCSLFISLVPFLYGEQGNAQEVFTYANNMYRQQSYQKALDAYEKIESKGHTVWYNMGNCAYRLKNFGYAQLYWLRAVKQSPSIFVDAHHNLQILSQQICPSEEDVVDRMWQWITAVVLMIPLLWFQICMLLLVAFGLLCATRLSSRYRKPIVPLCGVLLVLFMFLSVLRFSLDSRIVGVVVAPQTALLSGPAATFETLKIASQASQVTIEAERKDYFKVSVDGRIGWMKRSDVGRV